MVARIEQKGSGHAVCAVVVTHDRPALLKQCLRALAAQSLTCDVVVVDNASMAETAAVLNDWMADDDSSRLAVRSESNLGGSGGFAHGIRTALDWSAAQWLWLMDDDALVVPTSLQNLMASVDREDFSYASVAVGAEEGTHDDLVWHANTSCVGGEARTRLEELDQVDEVCSLPFLGFLVSRATVERVGVPDDSFFICADDLEYSTRIRHSGGRLLLVRNSVIYHPMPQRRCIRMLGRSLDFRYLPTVKSYYEVRNKIRVARRYWPSLLWSKTLPGLVVRLGLSLVLQNERGSRISAFAYGCWDGLRDVGGRRRGF